MSNNNSRAKNSLLNSLFGMCAYAFVMLSTMATRIAFARFLGEELLGLNSLYTSILQILQITELGICNAITVFLYKPIKLLDRQKINAIIHLYRRVYAVFVFILLTLGLIVLFFILPRIVVVSSINIKAVQIYFFLFLLSVVSTYVLAYSKSIFYAEQKNRFVSTLNAAQKVVVGILQIVVICKYKSYLVYLLLLIVGNLLENLICHITVRRQHPYLKERLGEALSKEDKKSIIDLIKPMFVVKVADKVLSQSDSILINQYINIVTLGMYANYHTIFNACIGLFDPIGSALTSSYGNLAVGADAQKKYQAYRKSYGVAHFVVLVFCGFFLAYIQDFIHIAYGDKFVLDGSLSIAMVIYLYLTLVKTIYYSYQNAMGLLKLDQIQTILQVPLNIILSIALMKVMGLNGIIWGTSISLLFLSLGYKGKLLYTLVFQEKARSYFFRTAKDLILALSTFGIIYVAAYRYSCESFTEIVLKFILLGILVVGISLTVSLTDVDFRGFLKNFLLKVKRKAKMS